MAMRSNFMADLAQMANGAASAFGGMREEIDNMIRQRMERSLNARGLVTREEFDALRTRHEAVAARLSALEAKKIPKAADSSAAKPARRKPAKATTAAAKKAKK
jgi:BMFP domain-containing protein YqiC